MVVVCHISIKTFLSAPHLYLQDQSARRKDLKVTVNRSQAYPGQAPPGHFIDLVSGGVIVDFFNFIKNDLPLASHSELLMQ